MCKKCGCNTCETEIRGPLLTEGKIKGLISNNLQYHIDKNIPLMENVFRIGSDAHLSMIKEARKLYTRNALDLCEDDKALMETHIGEFDLFENEIVPLDLPMLNEVEIGDKVKIDKKYGGGKGEVKDKIGSFVVVNDKSYHESDVDKVLDEDEAIEDDLVYEKLKGLDGKACWKGYKLSGTKKKDGKTVDNCIPMEENQKSPKFKIDDFVQPKDRNKYIGQIEDVYINKPENLEIKDGEYVYSVAKLNHRGRNAMSFDFKESDLESISDPTEYIKGLQQYKRLEEIDEDDEYEIASRKLFDMTWDEVRKQNNQYMVQDVHDEVSKDDSDGIYFNENTEEQYPSFEVDKNIKYQDMNITKGYWTYTGKESAGRGVYLNAMNQQMLGFNREDIEIFQKNLPSHFNIIKESLDEAEFKGKEVALGKPKRGGSKAYYVYVKDGDKVKKVTFGSGGLRAKIKNKEARNAFAARHKCKDKKDRTTAGYWSCNLPRYASQLGLGANQNTFW